MIFEFPRHHHHRHPAIQISQGYTCNRLSPDKTEHLLLCPSLVCCNGLRIPLSNPAFHFRWCPLINGFDHLWQCKPDPHPECTFLRNRFDLEPSEPPTLHPSNEHDCGYPQRPCLDGTSRKRRCCPDNHGGRQRCSQHPVRPRSFRTEDFQEI